MSPASTFNRTAYSEWKLPADDHPEKRVPVRVFSSDILLETISPDIIEKMAVAASLPEVLPESCLLPNACSASGIIQKRP